MTGFVLAAPAAEPISLAETKAYLRLDGAAEDGLVTTLIAAARQHLEATMGLALIAQSWRVVLDDWPADGAVALPRAPLLSLTSVTAYDGNGDPQTLDVQQFATRSGLATAEQLASFPPTIMINGETDELRVSGEAFARTLRAAGVPIQVSTETGTVHGHLNRPEEPGAHASLERFAARINALATPLTTSR